MNSFYEKISKSRFYAFGDKLGDLLIASVLWLLLCLPIVTFIPSTAALYYTKYNLFALIIIVFLLGLFVTIAEPDLSVLASRLPINNYLFMKMYGQIGLAFASSLSLII